MEILLGLIITNETRKLMKKLIRLSKSCIDEKEKEAVLRVLDKEFLGMGNEVNTFEKSLEKYFGRDVVCVSTGTSALQIALQSIGIKKSDEVLVPSLTYVASYQSISATGAIPISCDINPDSLIIDLNDAKEKLSEKTKAIMPVHYAGDASQIIKINAFANKHKLRVVEDAAHAFGSFFKNKKIGSFGDIACFSFDGIKNITSGEGGCIVSNDKNVIGLCKDLRLLGVENDSNLRFQGKRSWNFDVKYQGWRYHMSNIMASIGLEQFKKMEVFRAKRRSLAKTYDTVFSKILG